MNINITGIGVEITEPLRNYVNSKIQKLTTFFSNITNVTFVFSALCYFDKIHLQFIENMLR